MNLFEVQERLKDFSKSQLVNEMQRPSGMAPQYLVLSELQRRGRMEKAFAAEQAKQGSQSTVAQDAVNAAGMPQGGLAQMAQAMAPRTDMAQNTGVAPVQGMAEGGKIRRDVYERNRPREMEEDDFRGFLHYEAPDDFRGRYNYENFMAAPEPERDPFLFVADDPFGRSMRDARAAMRTRADERYEADLRDAIDVVGEDYEGAGKRERSLSEEDANMRRMIANLMRSQSETVSGFAEGGMTSFPTFNDAGTDKFDEYLIIENIMRDVIPADEALPGGMSDELRDELARRRAIYTDRKREGGEVRRMQPGGIAGINRNVAAFMPMRRGARGNQFMSLTPDEMGGTIAVNALVADPRIREAAARSRLSPEDYISRLNPDQFSSAIEMLSQPIQPSTVRDEASFEMQGQPVPDLSAPGLSESGLTGVPPVPVVSMEDIVAEASLPENRTPVTDAEFFQVLGAPFVAEINALVDPELEGITEEAARRLGDLYVRGVERAAETPLGLPSLEDTIAATRTTSSAITGALADQLGFGPEPTLSGDFLADFQNYGMDAVNREGATVTEGPNDLEIRRALANDPSLTQAERDAYAAQAAALEYLYNAGQTADDAIADAYALTGRVAGAGLEGLGRGVSFFSPEAGAPLISFGRDVSTSMDPIAEQGFFPGVSGDQAVDSTGAETPSMVPVPRPDNLVPPSEAPTPIAGGGSGGSGGTGGGGRGRGTDGDRMLEQDKWLALAQFGLGLMSSKAPTLGQAIGEAGTTALGQLQKSRAAAVERDLAERTLAARSAVRPDRLSLSDRLRFITDQMETIRAQIALEPEPGRKMDLADELASLQQQAADIMGTAGPNTARAAGSFNIAEE